MNPESEHAEDIEELTNIYSSSIVALLMQVEREIETICAELHPQCLDPCAYLLEINGKRLRPALTLLASRFGREPRGKIVSLAAAFEIAHTATLYHDDVIDLASLRRGQPSANHCWNNRVAVFAGDYLLARAFDLIASLQDDLFGQFSRGALAVWSGQMMEIENLFNPNLSQADYLKIITQKTATLFELPCRLGAQVSKVPSKLTRALTQYGHNLGIAFQIVDDALDIERCEPGNPSDLDRGLITLPLIRLLDRDNFEARELRSIIETLDMSPDRRDAAVDLLKSSGVVLETLSLAQHYFEKAIDSAHELPSSIDRKSMIDLCELLMEKGQEI